MLEAYKTFWVKSFDFTGKTRRIDFWLAFIANILALTLVIVVGALCAPVFTGLSSALPTILVSLYAIATILPNISIQVRRLRDAGHSPWLILISLVPYVGGIALLVLYCRASKATSVT